jgi:hypothetical protein
MNNIIISIKRFFTNKNTVTILGVIVVVAIIYFGYNYQIKKATEPVTVPVAKETIQPRTLITKDMVEYITVPAVARDKGKVLTTNIIGKYSNINTVIPKGSMFYTGVVVEKSAIPDALFEEIAEGEVPYNFPVTMASTYGNSIVPGNYVDIYMKAVDDTNELIIGKFLENVKVLAVKDSSGNNVFENTDAKRTPAYLYFGVVDDVHILLRKASYMTGNSVVLFPVPHGMEYTDEELATTVSTQYLRDFINAHSVVIDETQDENLAIEG